MPAIEPDGPAAAAALASAGFVGPVETETVVEPSGFFFVLVDPLVLFGGFLATSFFASSGGVGAAGCTDLSGVGVGATALCLLAKTTEIPAMATIKTIAEVKNNLRR